MSQTLGFTDEMRILIVDDSLIFRRVVEEVFKGEQGIKVVGSVMNGVKAMEFIKSSANPPDLVTLDLEMPEMNGLETLEAIQKFNDSAGSGIGVIMVSAHTIEGAGITITALENGAFDFVTKPNAENALENMDSLRKHLMMRVRQFGLMRKKNGRGLPAVAGSAKHPVVVGAKPASAKAVSVVVIGVSTGGPKALVAVMPAISDAVEVPILVVQHMPPIFTSSLAESLNSKCRHEVVEASNGEEVRNDRIYIAPGGRHMLVGKTGGKTSIVVNDRPAENGCRPSVDVLFRSAALAYSGGIVAVVLTGMGADGSQALAALKRAGAHILAQDQATSVVWGMPGSAVATGHVDEVLPLTEIPPAVKRERMRRE
ncbi:MAG: chemotaxis response regulator protein-glutamate methylesterase [Nitrospinae bacterium]|nr:chemotaxis response regulator protein-glutamate methylesterase [Nitrospinota bacterium]